MAGRHAGDLVRVRNLAGGIFAVFAAAAGIAQALEAPVWVRLAFGAIGLVGAVVALILLWKESGAHHENAERAGAAVRVDLWRDQDGTRLTASNQGSHLVRDIQIVAVPAEDSWMASTHGPLPALYPSGNPEVKLTAPIVGGWFLANVRQLSPGDGVAIARYDEEPADYLRMQIDVRWNDHENFQRKRFVTADLRDVDGELPMKVRETV